MRARTVSGRRVRRMVAKYSMVCILDKMISDFERVLCCREVLILNIAI